MNDFKFHFSIADFNNIFPFYLLLDDKLTIKHFGKSLSKILPELHEGHSFSEVFYLKRPFIKLLHASDLEEITNQLVIFESFHDSSIRFKGQFEMHNGSFLFVGSPWFSSVEEVTEKGLTLRDFAIHDPLMDLLHILKNQEITNDELKDLLITINEQKINLKKEKEELNKLSLVASANKNGVVFLDLDGKIFWTNEAYCIQTGNTETEILGKTLLKIGKSENTNEAYLQKMLKAFNERETFDCEVLHKKKSNEIFWSRMKGQCVMDAEGNPSHYFVIIEDITQEKYFTDKLKESENRLSSLIINLQTGILLEDENRKIILVNQRFCDMFGIDAYPDMMKGIDCSNSAEESKSFFKSSDTFVDRINEILKRKKTVISETLELVDGRTFERTYTPIYSGETYKGHLWSYDDVTLKVKHKENLRIEKEKYSSIIDNMNIGLIEVDNNDVIQLANLRFSEMSGYPIDYLIGKKGTEVFLDDVGKNKMNEEMIKRASGISGSYEITVKNKQGELRDWLISGGPNYNENGETIGSIGLHFDVTENKILEAQKEDLLRKLEIRNEYLNEFAQIVSHDLKSPLRSIHSLITWINEDNATVFNETTQNYFSLILDKVEKMDFLIHGLLAYSKIDDDLAEKDKLNIDDIVTNVISTIFIPDHIKVNVMGKLPEIYANRFRTIQLFQNLITNAVNYNDKEIGVIEINVKEYKNHYVFSIKDNGPGIPEEYQEKVFKIFQSLHKDEKSTGIGLSIVKKIIENEKGKIWIDSEVGKGATFFFTINK